VRTSFGARLIDHDRESGASTGCAVSSAASAVVTGDKHLLALGAYEGISIMTVAELLYTFPQFPEGPPSTPPISE
jgi:predicted nucleic acid-binding protein